jgi:hypothetical protein
MKLLNSEEVEKMCQLVWAAEFVRAREEALSCLKPGAIPFAYASANRAAFAAKLALESFENLRLYGEAPGKKRGEL